MTNTYLVALSTCPDRETADKIADTLVGAGHAACVNIVSGLTSVYRWQGQAHRDAELLLVIKTTQAAYRGLEEAVRRLHPDEVPEVVALPIAGGLDDYLSWVSAQTAKDA